MTDSRASTMRRDLVSAYVLTAARVGAWVAVSGAVYRLLGVEAFAMVALVRATVGLLGYVALGIGPAMVRMLSVAQAAPADARSSAGPPAPAVAAPVAAIPVSLDDNILAYASPQSSPAPSHAVARVYVTGEIVAVLLGIVGLVLAGGYAAMYSTLHAVPLALTGQTRALAMLFGVGIVFRVISEAPSGLLQVKSHIALDNLLAAGTEIAWATATVAWMVLIGSPGPGTIVLVGACFALANLLLLIARSVAGRMVVRALTSAAGAFDRHVARQLVVFGGLVVVGQMADFLYAPVDYILINRLIDPETVAVYAPAVQIDSGLLLGVTAIAAVLLPKAALAHASGNHPLLRRYYLRGTLLTGLMLLLAGLCAWALSPIIFRWWLGDAMPVTQAILPLILIHTVVGGSSAVGRSILLGMGKVRAFTISVVLAGAGNVLLSYLFVRLGWGLRGIVLGTIVVVTLRAGLWLPWYVMRALRARNSKFE
jgi:O-antigen/teichoic acid export membrane protein